MAAKYKYPGLRPPPVENDAPIGAKLGQKVEATFTRFIQKVITWGWEFGADLLIDIADNVFHLLQPGTTRATQDIFAYLRTVDDLPPWFTSVMKAVEDEQGESSPLLRLAVFFVAIRSIIFGGMAPLQRLADYNADKKARSFLPDVQTATIAHRRGLMSDSGYTLTMQQLGLHDNLVPMFQKLVERVPDVNDLIGAKLRGVISDEQFKKRLIDGGVSIEETEIYFELAKQIPNVQDLIRMMVREAFNEQAISQFGLDEEYPEQANEYLSKLGLSEEWGRRYWAAHWQLPSPTQVFEMLHRGLIDDSEVERYLKTADYSSFWREKLKGISYNIMTRVDLRRLFQAGIIDRDYVYKNYKSQGYTDEDAERLTQFAEIGASINEKDLTKADIIGLYKDGLQDRSATSADLVKMGYDSEEAEDLLLRADFDIKKAEKTDAINWIEERYLAGTITKDQASAELSLAGLSTMAVERRILEFERKRESSKAIPSNAEARKLFLTDIITEDDYRGILKLRNYNDQYIDWFIKDALASKGLAEDLGNA